MKRRTFIHQSARAGAAFSILGMAACKDKTTKTQEAEAPAAAVAPFFKLSLAQWSIHRMIFQEGTDPYTFAEKAKGWGFEGLEYVSQLYRSTLEPAGYSPEAMQRPLTKSRNAKLVPARTFTDG